MKRLAAVAAAVALAGCGEEPAGLPGAWGMHLTTAPCFIGFRFEADGRMQVLKSCEVGGGVGIEAHHGTYAADAETVTFTTERSSCGSAAVFAGAAGYRVLGNSLTLTFPASVFLLERLRDAPGGSTGAAVFGCFNPEFRPSPVVEVK